MALPVSSSLPFSSSTVSQRSAFIILVTNKVMMLASEAIQIADVFGSGLDWAGSKEPELVSSPEEERRRRRMISNRESARRSRMRKQLHLEDLRAQLDRLSAENRKLEALLGVVAQRCLVFRSDNQRLRSEHAHLSSRLAELRQVIAFRKLQHLANARVGDGGGLRLLAPGTQASFTT